MSTYSDNINYIESIYNTHVDMVYRLCFSFMKNNADTEDAVQTTFLKFLSTDCRKIKNEKAWLIVCASNVCRDILRKKKTVPLDDITEPSAPGLETGETLSAILSLPDKYKTAIYMYYYEGYSCKEISHILCKPNSTIRSWLRKGRQMLKIQLGGDFDEK